MAFSKIGGLPDIAFSFSNLVGVIPVEFNPTQTCVEIQKGVTEMLKDLFRNRVFIGGFVLLICAAAGLYLLYTDNPKEPILIVKSVEPIEKSTAKAGPVGDTSPDGHWHGNVWHSEPHTDVFPSVSKAMTEVRPPETEKDIDFPETQTDSDAGVDPKLPWKETSEAERLTQKLFKDWEDFAFDLQVKYSTLFDQQSIERVARTREGRQQIKKQASAMVQETLDEFERLFSQLPSDFSNEVLDSLEEHFGEDNHGIPEKYIDQMLERMRSRIN